MISEEYFTRLQAASMMNVNPNTVWRWVKKGKLKGEKVGRELLIRKEDLRTFTKNPRGRKPRNVDSEPK